MILLSGNQFCKGWRTFAWKSVLGASCYDWDWSGCIQADRENDGREEIVKSLRAEIVKRTWTEIRLPGSSCYLLYGGGYWHGARMLTLHRSLTNTDHILIANTQKSKQSQNLKKWAKTLEPDGEKSSLKVVAASIFLKNICKYVQIFK